VSDSKLSDIDWTGPAVDIVDALVEIWFERHPNRAGDDIAHDEANEWADEMFAKHAK
jgi:hypothetical protein